MTLQWPVIVSQWHPVESKVPNAILDAWLFRSKGHSMSGLALCLTESQQWSRPTFGSVVGVHSKVMNLLKKPPIA